MLNLTPYLLNKKTISVLDVGCGPNPVVCAPPYADVNAFFCDKRDFDKYWIEVQDMEKLTYFDNSFDLVYCINALDHTRDAKAAIKELIRVSREHVYIDCALIQRTTSPRGHYWDAIEDGTFRSKDEQFNLKEFGFKFEVIGNHPDRRYNHLIARLQK